MGAWEITPLSCKITALFLGLILFVIALLHFHWAFGGRWGFNKAIPFKEDGNPLFVPTNLQSGIVGFGLMLMVYIIFLKTTFTNSFLPMWVYNYGYYFLAGIFILRAIGDFKYVGFFKKVKNTPFAELDSKFYSPLCLLIGIAFIWIELNLINGFTGCFG